MQLSLGRSESCRGARSHLKGRVIPAWSLPLAALSSSGSPPPPRSLSAGGGEGGRDRSGRQVFPLVLFECVGPPHHSPQFHPLAFQRTGAAPGCALPDQLRSQPSSPPLLPRETEDFISSGGLFFCFSLLWFRSVLLPPGCRCATRTDIDTSVCGPQTAPNTETQQHLPIFSSFLFFFFVYPH